MSSQYDAEPLTLYFDQKTLTEKQMGEAIFIFEQLFGASLQIVESEIVPPDSDSGSGQQVGEWINQSGGQDSPHLNARPSADS